MIQGIHTGKTSKNYRESKLGTKFPVLIFPWVKRISRLSSRRLVKRDVCQALKCLECSTRRVVISAGNWHNAGMDKRKIFLVLWLVGMLFPLNLIWKLSEYILQAINALVQSELSHVVGHTILFGGLVILLLYIFDLPLTRRTAVLMALNVLAVGLLQEFFQLQFKARGFGWPEIFDLGVDLVGGVLGWVVYCYYQRYSRYFRIVFFILMDA